ncbi:MAG: hypothetical protein ACO1RX_11360 [Candidatus Sericytochromatia bacterium]
MLKKMSTVLAGALVIGGSLVAPSAQQPAEAAPTYFKCAKVSVTAPYAWMKAYPWLSSRTLRTARRGEVLQLVSPGNPTESRGWYLVLSNRGYRYWVHNSVVGCMNS